MITSNYHTHTFRCHHASGTEREYIDRAVLYGLKTLGFSDHAPYILEDGSVSGFRLPPSDVADYVQTLEALEKEYNGKIKILIGYEAEYYPALFGSLLKRINEHRCDYLVLGQHFIGNEIGAAHCLTPTEDESILARYVSQVCEGMNTGKYSCVVHPDFCNYVGDGAIYRKHMKELCLEAKRLSIPLEINLLGLGTGRIYPSDRFFSIASEVGNAVIVGCDAHEPKNVYNPEVLTKCEQFIKRNKLNVIDTLEIRNCSTT